MAHTVHLYSLSTCQGCQKTKELLAQYGVPYQCTEVDTLKGEEGLSALEEVARINPARSFPTLVCGDRVVVGFDHGAIMEALHLSERAAALYQTLRPLQEKQGYFFNLEVQRVFELLDALLLNRDRYGYMACPCRLAAGDRERDRDIICPCLYREPDVKEYGSCYCNLYVSSEWNEGTIPREYVPERRPAEKFFL